MKTTIELMKELNTMQTDHIKGLNERIDVLQETIDVVQKLMAIDKITINTQQDTIELYLNNLNFINQLSNK